MNAVTQHQQMQMQIGEQERAKRQASVNFARGSVRLEGFVLSSKVEDISRRYINGELTGDEHIAAIKAAVADE